MAAARAGAVAASKTALTTTSSARFRKRSRALNWKPSEYSSHPSSMRLMSTRRISCSTRLRYCTTGKPAVLHASNCSRSMPRRSSGAMTIWSALTAARHSQHGERLGPQDARSGVRRQPRIDFAETRMVQEGDVVVQAATLLRQHAQQIPGVLPGAHHQQAAAEHPAPQQCFHHQAGIESAGGEADAPQREAHRLAAAVRPEEQGRVECRQSGETSSAASRPCPPPAARVPATFRCAGRRRGGTSPRHRARPDQPSDTGCRAGQGRQGRAAMAGLAFHSTNGQGNTRTQPRSSARGDGAGGEQRQVRGIAPGAGRSIGLASLPEIQ